MRKQRHETPVPRHLVRGNQMMIDKVYAFADQATELKHAAERSTERRDAAADKRVRKAAKRAALINQR